MLLGPALIALVVLTGLSLGIARGQTGAGTRVVLCGGTAVIIDPDDPQGAARYCPDMAAGLLLALDPPPVAVAPDERPWRRTMLPQTPGPTHLSQPAPQARGPPLPRHA